MAACCACPMRARHRFCSQHANVYWHANFLALAAGTHTCTGISRVKGPGLRTQYPYLPRRQLVVEDYRLRPERPNVAVDFRNLHAERPSITDFPSINQGADVAVGLRHLQAPGPLTQSDGKARDHA